MFGARRSYSNSQVTSHIEDLSPGFKTKKNCNDASTREGQSLSMCAQQKDAWRILLDE